MSSYADVLRVALGLSSAERSELVGAMLESLHDASDEVESPPIWSDAWRGEILARSAAYKRGEVSTIPWDEVRDRILRKYGDHV
jgi:putative addiction module component (TIGR02574 family)